MFLANLLKRIREKNQRRELVRELILSLKIDETQRSLYLESLELLDDEGVSAFYARLTNFVDSVESRVAVAEGWKASEAIVEIRKQEEEERRMEANKVSFFFD